MVVYSVLHFMVSLFYPLFHTILSKSSCYFHSVSASTNVSYGYLSLRWLDQKIINYGMTLSSLRTTALSILNKSRKKKNTITLRPFLIFSIFLYLINSFAIRMQAVIVLFGNVWFANSVSLNKLLLDSVKENFVLSITKTQKTERNI